MKSRSVKVQDQLFDLQLECSFWDSLDEIIESLGTSLQGLVGQLYSANPEDLASDLRVFVLQHYQRQAGFDMSDVTSLTSGGWKSH